MPADTRHRPSSVEALRERIEALQEENRQFRDLLLPRIQVPPDWRLTPSEANFVVAARSAAPGILTCERASIALYGFDEDRAISTRNVFLMRARRKLAKAAPEIKIKTIWAQGYLMPPDAVAAFDRLTRRAAP